jgi:lactoylglutathione lyase
MRVNYIIIFVSDMKRAVSYYRDIIELPLKFESPEWTEFVNEGATLALHKSDKSPGQCRPGFQVPNLKSFHQRMIERKVSCVQEPTEVFGSMVAQYVDPDGLIFSVGEETK